MALDKGFTYSFQFVYRTGMDKLSKDWLTQGLIDFEYKKYVLLGYLNFVNNSFSKVELYPFMSDLVFHYRNLQAIKENKSLLRESFPKEISLEDFKKLEVRYKELIEDDTVMNELQSIIEFAIPQIQETIQDGSEIFEYVESQCEVAPIGVTPLYAKEGYLFVTQPPQNETNVYRYQVSIFEDANEQYRSLNTEHLDTFNKSPLTTYESLKLNLIKQFKDLPNPATYLILSKMKFPFTATLMPVVKRLFVKQISVAS